jgi:hypothetical protein
LLLVLCLVDICLTSGLSKNLLASVRSPSSFAIASSNRAAREFSTVAIPSRTDAAMRLTTRHTKLRPIATSSPVEAKSGTRAGSPNAQRCDG